MFMNPSCKQYVHQQEIVMHMIVMHIITLWSSADFGKSGLEKIGLDNTRTLLIKHVKESQEYQDWGDM